MKIVYTNHVLSQANERKIERIWIKETIKNPDAIIKIGRKKYCARKKLNGLTLEVIYVKERFIKAITIYSLK